MDKHFKNSSYRYNNDESIKEIFYKKPFTGEGYQIVLFTTRFLSCFHYLSTLPFAK